MSWATIAEDIVVPSTDNSLSEEAEFNLVRSKFGNVVASGNGSIDTILTFVNDSYLLLKKYDGAIELKYMLFFSLKALVLLCLEDAAVEKDYTYSVGLLSLSFMPEDVEDTSYIFRIARLAFDRKDYWSCIKLCQLRCLAADTQGGAAGGVNMYRVSSAHLCDRALAAATSCSVRPQLAAAAMNVRVSTEGSCYYVNRSPLLVMCPGGQGGGGGEAAPGLVDPETTLMVMRNRLNWFLFQLQRVFVLSDGDAGAVIVEAVVHYYHYVSVRAVRSLQEGLPQDSVRSPSLAVPGPQAGWSAAFAEAVPCLLPLSHSLKMNPVGSLSSPAPVDIAATGSPGTPMEMELEPVESPPDPASECADAPTDLSGAGQGAEATGAGAGTAEDREKEVAPVVTRRSSRHQLAAGAEETQPGAALATLETRDSSSASAADRGAALLAELRLHLKEQFGHLVGADLVVESPCGRETSPAELLARVHAELRRFALIGAVVGSSATEAASERLDADSAAPMDPAGQVCGLGDSVDETFAPLVSLLWRLGSGEVLTGVGVPFRSFCLETISAFAELADRLCSHQLMSAPGSAGSLDFPLLRRMVVHLWHGLVSSSVNGIDPDCTFGLYEYVNALNAAESVFLLECLVDHCMAASAMEGAGAVAVAVHPVDCARYCTSLLVTSVQYIASRGWCGWDGPACSAAGRPSASLRCRRIWIMLYARQHAAFGLSCDYEHELEELAALTALLPQLLASSSAAAREVRLGGYMEVVETICRATLENKVKFYRGQLQQLRNGEIYDRGRALLAQFGLQNEARGGASTAGKSARGTSGGKGGERHVGRDELLAWLEEARAVVVASDGGSTLLEALCGTSSPGAGATFNMPGGTFSNTAVSDGSIQTGNNQFVQSLPFLVLRVASELRQLPIWAAVCTKLLTSRAVAAEQLQQIALHIPIRAGGDNTDTVIGTDMHVCLCVLLALRLCDCADEALACRRKGGSAQKDAAFVSVVSFVAALLEAGILLSDNSEEEGVLLLQKAIVRCFATMFGCTDQKLGNYRALAAGSVGDALLRLFNGLCCRVLESTTARSVVAHGSIPDDSVGSVTLPCGDIVQEVLCSESVRAHMLLFATKASPQEGGEQGELLLLTAIFIAVFMPTSQAAPTSSSSPTPKHGSIRSSRSSGAPLVDMDASQKASFVLACAKLVLHQACVKRAPEVASAWNDSATTAPVVINILHYFVGVVFNQLELDESEATSPIGARRVVGPPVAATLSDAVRASKYLVPVSGILGNLRELFAFDSFSEDQVTDLTDMLGGYYSVHYYCFPDEHANYFDDSVELVVGMKVDARYKGLADWYPGEIIKARSNGSYEVEYDDGDRETALPREMIRCRLTKANLRLGRQQGVADGPGSVSSKSFAYSDADTVALFQYLKICDELGVYSKSKLRSGYRHLFVHSKLLQSSGASQSCASGSDVPPLLHLVNKYLFFVPPSVQADAILASPAAESASATCSAADGPLSAAAVRQLMYCFDIGADDLSADSELVVQFCRSLEVSSPTVSCSPTAVVTGSSLWPADMLSAQLDQMLTVFYFDFAMLGIQMNQVGLGLFHDTLCDSISSLGNSLSGATAALAVSAAEESDDVTVGEEAVEAAGVPGEVGVKRGVSVAAIEDGKRRRVDCAANQSRPVRKARSSSRPWGCEDFIGLFVWDICVFYKDLYHNGLRVETYEKLFNFCHDIHTVLCDDIAQVILPIPGSVRGPPSGEAAAGFALYSSLWRKLLEAIMAEVSRYDCSADVVSGAGGRSCSLLYLLLVNCGASAGSDGADGDGCGDEDDSGDESVAVNIGSICSDWDCPDSIVALCEAILLHANNVASMGSGDVLEALNSVTGADGDAPLRQLRELAQDVCVLLFMQCAVLNDMDRLGSVVARMLQLNIAELKSESDDGAGELSQKQSAGEDTGDSDDDASTDAGAGLEADNRALIEKLRLRLRRVLVSSGTSYYTQAQLFENYEYSALASSRLPTYSLPVCFGPTMAVSYGDRNGESDGGMDLYSKYIRQSLMLLSLCFELHTLDALSETGPPSFDSHPRHDYSFVHNDDDMDLPSCFSLFAAAKMRWVCYSYEAAAVPSLGRVDVLSTCLGDLHQCYVVSTLKTTQGGGSPNSLDLGAGEVGEAARGGDRHISYVSHKKDEWRHCRTVSLAQLHCARLSTALHCLRAALTGDGSQFRTQYGVDGEALLKLLETYRFQAPTTDDAAALVPPCSGSVQDARLRLWTIAVDCLGALRMCRSNRYDSHDWVSVYEIAAAQLELSQLVSLLQGKGDRTQELQWVTGILVPYLPALETGLAAQAAAAAGERFPHLRHDGSVALDAAGAGASAAGEELSKMFTKRRVQVVAVWKVDQTSSNFDLMLRQREITYNQTRLRLVRAYTEVLVRVLDMRSAEELLGFVPNAGSISTPSDALIVRWCIACYLAVLERVVDQLKSATGGGVADAGAAGAYQVSILKRLNSLHASCRVGPGGGAAVRYRLSQQQYDVLQQLIIAVFYLCGGSIDGQVPAAEEPDADAGDTAFRLVLQGVAKLLSPPTKAAAPERAQDDAPATRAADGGSVAGTEAMEVDLPPPCVATAEDRGNV